MKKIFPLQQMLAVMFLMANDCPAYGAVDPSARELLNAFGARHQLVDSTLVGEFRYVSLAANPKLSWRLRSQEKYQVNISLIVDEPKDRMAVRGYEQVAGFDFCVGWISTPDAAYELDFVSGKYLPGRRVSRTASLILPHYRLTDLKQNVSDLTSESTDKNTIFHYIRKDNSKGSLIFDNKTKYLSKVKYIINSPLGDDAIEIDYKKYHTFAGASIPGVITVTIRNEVLGVYKRTYKLRHMDNKVQDSPFNLPASLKPFEANWRKGGMFITKIADQSILLGNISESDGQWSENIPVLEFKDHLVVVDALSSEELSEKVIVEAGRRYPGKPIRYLLLTHHHEDHIAGLGPYLAQGATLIVTPDTARLLNEVARRTGAKLPNLRMKVVRDEFRNEDERNRLHVHMLRGGKHSDQMLLAYLPGAAAIFQADLINVGEFPFTDDSRMLLRWIAASEIKVEKIFGSHGDVLNLSNVKNVVASQASARSCSNFGNLDLRRIAAGLES